MQRRLGVIVQMRKGIEMLKPSDIAKSGSESAHQMAFFQWAAICKSIDSLDNLFSIPNGGDRKLSVAAKMKAEGVKKGVPDICWPVPRGKFHSLWIEFKRPGLEKRKWGGRAEEQVAWHRFLIRHGHAVAVCYGWEAGVRAVETYADGAFLNAFVNSDDGRYWDAMQYSALKEGK